MLVTQKKQYALRAVFELARRINDGPIKAARIAEDQSIPYRFLEVILAELKRSGIVNSKRGYYGGYKLAVAPDELTIGRVFKALEKPGRPAECIACLSGKKNCPLEGRCAFISLWNRVQGAITSIYDRTTIQDLLGETRRES